MNRPTRHARGLLAAIAVLALTAGAAFAARSATAPPMPAAASGGLERATEVSGKTVPVTAPTANEDGEAEQPAEDEPEENAGEHPDNHGAVVSEAAQGETPESFDNHGQYVRSVATDNNGHDPAAERGKSQERGAKPNR